MEENKRIPEEVTELAEAIKKILDDKKAFDVSILHIGDHSVLADYFVIATGTSNTHIRSLSGEVEFGIREKLGIEPARIEGIDNNAWVLLDYHSVIVHIFTRDAREFYKLDKLWAGSDSAR